MKLSAWNEGHVYIYILTWAAAIDIIYYLRDLCCAII